jgi:hypothetical protein
MIVGPRPPGSESSWCPPVTSEGLLPCDPRPGTCFTYFWATLAT